MPLEYGIGSRCGAAAYRLALISALGLLLVLGPLRLAGAQARRSVQLRYTRGPGTDQCPGEDGMKGLVSSRLGYEPFDDNATAVLVVRVEKRGAALLGVIERTDAAGQNARKRELSSLDHDCGELAESLALALSMAIDPFAARPPAIAASAPVSSSSAMPSPAAASSAVPTMSAPQVLSERPASSRTPSHKPDERARWRGGVGAQTSFGIAPAATFDGVALAGIRAGMVSVGVEALVGAPTTSTADGKGVKTWVLAGSVVPCVHYHAFLGCIATTLGALQARGEGVDIARRHTFALVAVGPRVGTELRLYKGLLLGLHGELQVALSRASIELNASEYWRAPVMSVTLGGAMIMEF